MVSKHFGEYLRELRISKRLSLRDVCRAAEYDPSNWSKIERGILPPPSDTETLEHWSTALELKADTPEHQAFLDNVSLSKGMIPKDILEQENIMEHIPAFFRTLRGQKPTKEEIEKLIELLKES